MRLSSLSVFVAADLAACQTHEDLTFKCSDGAVAAEGEGGRAMGEGEGQPVQPFRP